MSIRPGPEQLLHALVLADPPAVAIQGMPDPVCLRLLRRSLILCLGSLRTVPHKVEELLEVCCDERVVDPTASRVVWEAD